MKENSLLLVSINKWLFDATQQLQQSGIQTARLDALVLLADVLQRDKSWLLAHDEEQLASTQLQQLNNKLTQRLTSLPLAYIRGKQEFFGRSFALTPEVLIPRPETEMLIEVLLSLKPQAHDNLVDVGTGSGIIGITAKLEQPALCVSATDSSSAALQVARKNAENYQTDIIFLEQNLLDPPLNKPVRFLVANLPYVATDWERSPTTNYEPPQALFADDNGLALIKTLIAQSRYSLQSHGFLILEVDPRQHKAIIEFAKSYSYKPKMIRDFAICLQRR